MTSLATPVPPRDEVSAIVARYDRRKQFQRDVRIDILQPHRWQVQQEKERAYLRFLQRYEPDQIPLLRLLEVGCGHGSNLQQFLRWGFAPENLVGNELLPDRCEHTRRFLPESVRILPGDACGLNLPESSFDLVLQSTVFTSILDNAFQHRLANRMWSLLAPGGCILWYDFQFNNPRNPDVRGVGLSRIRELFPQGTVHSQRVALAPPIARVVSRVHPSLYTAFNTIPWLRTHLFCWIEKK